MSIRVGIPRALLYYYYFPMWSTFLEGLGAEVIVSGKTTKGILSRGLKNCVDEACLPIKLACGHVLELADKADYIFLPRMVSIASREYVCPKFLGFPDMVKRTSEKIPPLIDVNIDLYRKNKDMFPAFYEVAKLFSRNPAKIYLSYRKAVCKQREYIQLLERGYFPDKAMSEDSVAQQKKNEQKNKPIVALIGHPYNIYDHYISMNIIKRLSDAGMKVVTADHISDDTVREQAQKLPKRLFWTLGQRMIGAAFHYLEEPGISGLIHVASFACGPDSMTGELIERYMRRRSTIPFLNLTLDEHTGEAGVVTRLEAFLDMVQRRPDNTIVEGF